MAVNSLGKTQLGLRDFATSIMAGVIGAGIALGALLAGWLSRGRVNFRVMSCGAWGCVAMLLLMSFPGKIHGHLLGFWGSLPALLILGMFTAMFAIPLQVFLQDRPPKDQKGRVIAVQNFANFTAILLSGAVYSGLSLLVDVLDLRRAAIFAFTALLMLPVAVFYRPRADQPQAAGPNE
jgi:acyl-[acyl-carrier-protein]-phospholipid O-acyltransferase/long-chain-fatty-acid--[acyl-carrier-protein] ligase